MVTLKMEYSSPVDERMNVACLLEDLHQVLLEDEWLRGVGLPVKTKAVRIHQWFVGDALDSVDFIQLTLEVPQQHPLEHYKPVAGQLMTVLEQEAEKIEDLSVRLKISEQFCIRHSPR